MWTFIAAVIALLVGLTIGIILGTDVRAEFVDIKQFLLAEISKLHAKLEEILASVKK